MDASDPGWILDILPARDSIGWEDTLLADLLYRQLATVPCIPSVSGNLCVPGAVKLRPRLAQWDTVRDWLRDHADVEPEEWCHRSVENRERQPRAERLGARTTCLSHWLQSVAGNRSPVASSAAIRLAGILLKDQGLRAGDKPDLFSTPYILSSKGDLLCPSHSSLYLEQRDEDQVGKGESVVHPDVLAAPGVREILEGPLNLRSFGPVAQLERFLLSLKTGAGSRDWDYFWCLTRKMVVEHVVQLIQTHSSVINEVYVLSKRKKWIQIDRALLPGEIIPAEGASVDDDVVTIDSAGYHSSDIMLLEKLGAVKTVSNHKIEASQSGWFEEYRSSAIQQYMANVVPGSPRPSESRFVFEERYSCGPLDPLRFMSLASRARLVAQLLRSVDVNSQWTLAHKTLKKCSLMPFMHPSLWMINRYGALSTSFGPLLIRECVSDSLRAWRSVLPVADCSQKHADLLGLPSSLGALTENMWSAALKAALDLPDVSLVAQFYSEACCYHSAPAMILCDLGGVPSACAIGEICITTDHAAYMASQAAYRPILFLEDTDKARRLHERWQISWANDVDVKFSATGVSEPLIDRFPGLRQHLSSSLLELMICPCAAIWIEAPGTSGLSERRILENRAVICPDQILYPDDWADFQLLDGLIGPLKLKLSSSERQTVLDYLVREERQRIANAVREAQSVSEKLLVAIGATALRAGLPATWRERCYSEQDTANCALAVYGIQVLAHYGNDLESKGLNPPTRWAGSRRALQFVKELGIPVQYAGFRLSISREPWFEVDGPVRLPPLHGYQESIVEKLVEALQRVPPGRGMVSLPTGAGKTRVAVDSFVRWTVQQHLSRKFILWIAQSDELCEQAVQTWSRTWRALGPSNCTLRISRLWGGMNPQAEEFSCGCHVVIATYQTLVRKIDEISFSWVFEPDCVLIDEAHGAIARSYTAILTRLGITHAQTDRCLLGLTATPFRNGDFEDDTLRLVRRFASERYDHGVFVDDDPYSDLRQQRVLANVEHIELEGIQLHLTADEVVDFNRFDTLPPSAERRLGENVARNTRMLECLKGLDPAWPVLVFAASVGQAEMFAVELCMCGIESRAITAATDRGVRSHYIEEFRAGRVRVLTNYNVLTAGFDAPAVRAVCIARPVFSRVLYQQMIGRGLRGPANGGKDSCLLINVRDNVSQYGKELAFRHFEYLWKSH